MQVVKFLAFLSCADLRLMLLRADSILWIGFPPVAGIMLSVDNIPTGRYDSVQMEGP